MKNCQHRQKYTERFNEPPVPVIRFQQRSTPCYIHTTIYIPSSHIILGLLMVCFFIKCIGVTLVNELMRFQVYISTIHHLYIVLCAHLREANHLP